MRALDLFAGTGWGVACQWHGIKEWGVDNMPAVLRTREANDMATAFADVWDGLEDRALVPPHELLIASPPCQTFTLAGAGAGRRALDDVLRLIGEAAYARPADMRAFAAEHGDERTALVLAPLAYAWRFRPKYVVLEQVPPVLPVWEACAVALQEMGYSTWTGHLHAEQYGVPQTRRRAILIARADMVEAAPPTPTHSRYYPRDPQRLDEGVPRWTSMADALGHDHLPEWAHARPSTTIVGTFRPDIIAAPGWRKAGDGPRQNTPNSVQVTAEEAARLQSYPSTFQWVGSKSAVFQQIGNAVPPLLAKAILETLL